ncbi:MAG: hypothetical protein ACYSWP_03905, partial [Planctomycetota bacterium]
MAKKNKRKLTVTILAATIVLAGIVYFGIGNGSWLNMVYGEYQYWWNIDPCSVEVEMTDPCDNSK